MMQKMILTNSGIKVPLNPPSTPDMDIHERKSLMVFSNDSFSHPFILMLQKAIEYLALGL